MAVVGLRRAANQLPVCTRLTVLAGLDWYDEGVRRAAAGGGPAPRAGPPLQGGVRVGRGLRLVGPLGLFQLLLRLGLFRDGQALAQANCVASDTKV